MRVECSIEPDRIGPVPSTRASCRRCGLSRVVTGRKAPRVRAALAALRADCPNAEHNFYAAEGQEDERGVIVPARPDHAQA